MGSLSCAIRCILQGLLRTIIFFLEMLQERIQKNGGCFQALANWLYYLDNDNDL